jgi:MFS family permease
LQNTEKQNPKDGKQLTASPSQERAELPEPVESHPLRAAQRTLVLLSAAELLAMSLWFTGTAVLPQLAEQWRADVSLTAWLTMAVQLGFVAGALVIAIFNLPDVFSAPHIFVGSCIAAAAANGMFAAVGGTRISMAIALRFLTGAFLAGVYPTGMKILAGWYREGRGLALGVLIAALTVGSALPHGVHAFGTLPWRAVVYTSSALGLAAAVIVAVAVRDGPYAGAQPPFHLSQAGEVFRNRRLRLANFGYLGHMWELYSMWGWIAALLAASRRSRDVSVIELSAFFVIAVGAAGCVWAGLVSDAMTNASRVSQRSRVTVIAMAVSGACCLAAAVVFDHFWMLLAVALVWGVAVIADSAQFSAIVSEVADQRYVGTALALQTALGFLLTVVSLRVIAGVATYAGWRWAVAAMALGPALGILAMERLRRA